MKSVSFKQVIVIVFSSLIGLFVYNLIKGLAAATHDFLTTQEPQFIIFIFANVLGILAISEFCSWKIDRPKQSFRIALYMYVLLVLFGMSYEFVYQWYYFITILVIGWLGYKYAPSGWGVKKAAEYHETNESLPSDLDVIYSHAMNEMQNNNFDRALNQLKLIDKRQPDKKGLQTLIGTCQQALLKHTDAIKSFNQAILSDPKDCNLYFLRSNSLVALSDFKGHVKDIEKAIELSKEDNEINNSYHESAKEQGYENVTTLYTMQLIVSKLLQKEHNLKKNTDKMLSQHTTKKEG